MTPVLPSGRRRSLRSYLLGLGFQDSARAWGLLSTPALSGLEGSGTGQPAFPLEGIPEELTPSHMALLEELRRVADPDLALISLVRLAEAGGEVPALLRRSLGLVPSEIPDAELAHLRRLLAILGASSALADFLISHPWALASLHPSRAYDAPGQSLPAQRFTSAVEAALAGRGAERVQRARAALRVAYYERLLTIAADDLTASDPAVHTRIVGRRMAEMVDAALSAGLQIARVSVGPAADKVRLAIIAMGKTGGQELNYISDVDVIYVAEWVETTAEQSELARGLAEAVPSPASSPNLADSPSAAGHKPHAERPPIEAPDGPATHLAYELARILAAPGREPALWPLDTALRPEGKDGPLVRSLESHISYYQRWAKSWEFQALLKARHCAGDRQLGLAYLSALEPMVWEASRREGFVDDARAMRRRVEKESATTGEHDWRIKLGPGGLRDVEFTVQLLQLVHGKADITLRRRGTIAALDALQKSGYVSREDAATLREGYDTLRLLEHRSQLFRLRRMHALPSKEENVRRVGRGINPAILPDADAVRELLQRQRSAIRRVQQAVYYRPLLSAIAPLSESEVALRPEAARERLVIAGYRDPDAALRHMKALTEGLSRTASIQRQIMPAIIRWLGHGPDPDAGLLHYRRLSEAIGGSHWYMATLRDSPRAAKRLCHVLAGARWTTDRLAERPEAIAWLDDDAELAPRAAGALRAEAASIVQRRLGAQTGQGPASQAKDAIRALISLRSRELLRAALADSLDGLSAPRSGRIVSDAADALIDGVLAVSIALVRAETQGCQTLPGPRSADETRAEAGAHLGAFEEVSEIQAALLESSGAQQAASQQSSREPRLYDSELNRYAIIAMGRLGGREEGYASDADVLVVHEPHAGIGEEEASREAEAVIRYARSFLSQFGTPALALDIDLRPDGSTGPMSRTLASYADYYERHAATWERHALVRARPCAGDQDLGRRFTELIDPIRYNPAGLSEVQLREIRRLKARMESERLPRGVEASRHVKLGPGGLSDVEWSVQILQLRHAGAEPRLRHTSTLEALEELRIRGFISSGAARALRHAWLMATRLRAARVLGTGRTHAERVDVLPSEAGEVRVVGRLLGYEPGQENRLEEDWRRVARHAREVAEHLIYDDEASSIGSGPAQTSEQPVITGPTASTVIGGLSPAQIPDAERSHSRALSGSSASFWETGGTVAPKQQTLAAAGKKRTTQAGDSEKASPPTPVRKPHRPRRGTGPYPWS